MDILKNHFDQMAKDVKAKYNNRTEPSLSLQLKDSIAYEQMKKFPDLFEKQIAEIEAKYPEIKHKTYWTLEQLIRMDLGSRARAMRQLAKTYDLEMTDDISERFLSHWFSNNNNIWFTQYRQAAEELDIVFSPMGYGPNYLGAMQIFISPDRVVFSNKVETHAFDTWNVTKEQIIEAYNKLI